MVRKLIGWKLWYYNNESISSKQSSWRDCRQDGIECLKVFYDDGTQEFFSRDEYYLLGNLTISEIPKSIKLGKVMIDIDFEELEQKAKHDKEVIRVMI